MEGLQSSLASTDPYRLWLWGAFAVVATLYALNKGLIFYLSRRQKRQISSSGFRDWKPRPPPLWLTGWPRPKAKRPSGLLNREQSRELIDIFDRTRNLASVRPLQPPDKKVQEELEYLFRDLLLRDETQPALKLAFKGQYRRALSYVVRLAKWSEQHYNPPPPTGVWLKFGPTMAPSALWAEAGALARCLSDYQASVSFEKARALAPKWLTPLVVLQHLYAALKDQEKLRSVTQSLIVALENEKAKYEHMLQSQQLPGKAEWEVRQDIHSLTSRIETQRQNLEHIVSPSK